ncbi:hypothetical protein ABEB36_005040 [Hypothenemus hampei]|uniref:Coiled-coil domain-containing protein 22 homolog n=1 Tax=Hypothenemus hampei TaxID=57062 RepID=A0ABD1EWQ6_HYPHA
MEDVDKIIIDSLKNLQCDIDEDIHSLKQFDAENVICAVSTCLETINPQMKLPKKLPSSMSARIKLASNLATQVRENGFKGDMGYETILYSNEVEVRRVLMFLLERLPKGSHPSVSLEPVGYVPKVIKQIEDNLNLSLNKMWLPTEVLCQGIRETDHGIIVHSLGNSFPIDIVKLVVPDEDTNLKTAPHIPYVTRQCSPNELIPSLLFESSKYFSNSQAFKELEVKMEDSVNISSQVLDEIIIKDSVPSQVKHHDENLQPENENPEKIETLLNNLRESKHLFTNLQENIRNSEEKLLKLKHERTKSEKSFNDLEEKVKVKKKTLMVLNSEENKVKLNNLIQKAQNKFKELETQWNEIHTPLLEEHKALKISISSENLKNQNGKYKLTHLKGTYKELVNDFKQKNVIEQNLMLKCKEISNKNNRSAYTKRILEIVGNIQKQNKEIQKILADTRTVQKDINTLTGQIDRSFTLSDETIFHDCKSDESARRAYKYLAAIREECTGILEAVSNMGQAERELRNLEEQVEIEKIKNTHDKLEKVHKDLSEIKKEIDALI